MIPLLRLRHSLQKGKAACPSQHLPKNKLERFIIDKIKGHILAEGHILDLVKQSNEELVSASGKRNERKEVNDKGIEQWEGRWSGYIISSKQRRFHLVEWRRE